MKQRILFIDNLKCFAIFCVVLGHALQYTSGKYLEDNFVFNFIYTFHMPLFMMMSGYFFRTSLNLGLWSFVEKKTMQLLLPAICWSIIKIPLTSISDIGGGISFIIGSLWFLKSTFICYIVTYIAVKVFKSEKIAYAMIFILPFFVNINVSTFMLNYMLPSFVVGIWLNKYYSEMMERRNLVLGVCAIIFILLLPYWEFSEYYYTPIFLDELSFSINGACIYLHRMLIGISGSITLFLLFSFCNRSHHLVSQIGQSTLGIYIMNGLISDFHRHIYHYSVQSEWLCLAISLLITLAQLPLIMYAIALINKHKYSSILLLGKIR